MTSYTRPVIGDILDTMGLFHQFLPSYLHPVRAEMKIAGFAMPVLMMDVYGHQRQPFGNSLKRLILWNVMKCMCRGRDAPKRQLGELLTATAKARGAAGAVVDGFHRDTPQVLRQDFSVFSCGAYARIPDRA